MATLNLGRIKPVFRGAYSGSTAYVVDDIVTHGNESFICIQAHGAGTQATSVTANWTKLAAKGTDGTDVGTTITTQGDILFRDGSGLQRLASSGHGSKTLQMNSGATAPEWVTVTPPTADMVKIVTATGGGTSALAIDSCFSATYENYMIVASIYTTATTSVFTKIQNASNTEMTSDYSYAGTQTYRNSSSAGHDAKGGWNAGYISMEENIETAASNFGQYIIYINKPFATHFTVFTIDYHSFDSGSFRTVRMGASHRVAQSNAGMRFTANSGNITSSSKATVYGLKQ